VRDQSGTSDHKVRRVHLFGQCKPGVVGETTIASMVTFGVPE
jgi:hypothetical protein